MPPIPLAETDRRAFLAGTMALPLATVLAFPDLAHAQAARLEPVNVTTKTGGKVSGVIAMPKQLPAPAVILIHEWWGLNDQIKSVAAELAEQGYIALAVDLYGGTVARSPDEAQAAMKAVDSKEATESLAGAVDYLRGHKDSTGKVGTVGWCFGGGWSLNTALAAPVDACVVYYGSVAKKAGELQNLHCPVLGQFGTEDDHINKEMVEGFEAELKKAGKSELFTAYWYDADHAFANPTGARYDAEDAKLAWDRTTEFLHQYLSARS
ncbi:dienelactone hydrolase family protein [Faunimonas pinastri]|nr:dienelactone hydrolase family protein [Faunimonas pinastri]